MAFQSRMDYSTRGFKGGHLLVVPEQMQDDVIRRCHEQGHFGATKTQQLNSRDNWFQGIKDKVQRVIQNCVSCILAQRKQGKLEGILHPLDEGGSPMDTYHIDHLGPLPMTKKSYCHILAVINAFTKFVWLHATKTTSTSEVIDKLLRQSAVLGNPRQIISDRGTAFTSNEFERYCGEEEIEQSMIAAGVPRGNSQVERLNRILIPVLTKLSAPTPGDWHRHLDKAQQFSGCKKYGTVTVYIVVWNTNAITRRSLNLCDLGGRKSHSIYASTRRFER